MIKPDEIRQSYLFKGLQEDQLMSILGISQEKLYFGGDIVVRQFDKASDILVILSGKVKIKGFKGEDLAELAAGSVVGEIALVDSAPRSATVVSVGETRAALVPAQELTALMTRDVYMKATMMENLFKVLCSKLRTANLQLDSMPRSRD